MNARKDNLQTEEPKERRGDEIEGVPNESGKSAKFCSEVSSRTKYKETKRAQSRPVETSIPPHNHPRNCNSFSGIPIVEYFSHRPEKDDRVSCSNTVNSDMANKDVHEHQLLSNSPTKEGTFITNIEQNERNEISTRNLVHNTPPSKGVSSINAKTAHALRKNNQEKTHPQPVGKHNLPTAIIAQQGSRVAQPLRNDSKNSPNTSWNCDELLITYHATPKANATKSPVTEIGHTSQCPNIATPSSDGWNKIVNCTKEAQKETLDTLNDNQVTNTSQKNSPSVISNESKQSDSLSDLNNDSKKNNRKQTKTNIRKLQQKTFIDQQNCPNSQAPVDPNIFGNDVTMDALTNQIQQEPLGTQTSIYPRNLYNKPNIMAQPSNEAQSQPVINRKTKMGINKQTNDNEMKRNTVPGKKWRPRKTALPRQNKTVTPTNHPETNGSRKSAEAAYSRQGWLPDENRALNPPTYENICTRRDSTTFAHPNYNEILRRNIQAPDLNSNLYAPSGFPQNIPNMHPQYSFMNQMQPVPNFQINNILDPNRVQGHNPEGNTVPQHRPMPQVPLQHLMSAPPIGSITNNYGINMQNALQFIPAKQISRPKILHQNELFVPTGMNLLNKPPNVNSRDKRDNQNSYPNFNQGKQISMAEILHQNEMFVPTCTNLSSNPQNVNSREKRGNQHSYLQFSPANQTSVPEILHQNETILPTGMNFLNNPPSINPREKRGNQNNHMQLGPATQTSMPEILYQNKPLVPTGTKLLNNPPNMNSSEKRGNQNNYVQLGSEKQTSIPEILHQNEMFVPTGNNILNSSPNMNNMNSGEKRGNQNNYEQLSSTKHAKTSHQNHMREPRGKHLLNKSPNMYSRENRGNQSSYVQLNRIEETPISEILHQNEIPVPVGTNPLNSPLNVSSGEGAGYQNDYFHSNPAKQIHMAESLRQREMCMNPLSGSPNTNSRKSRNNNSEINAKYQNFGLHLPYFPYHMPQSGRHFNNSTTSNPEAVPKTNSIPILDEWRQLFNTYGQSESSPENNILSTKSPVTYNLQACSKSLQQNLPNKSHSGYLGQTQTTMEVVEPSPSNQHRKDETISNCPQTLTPNFDTQINQQIFRESTERQIKPSTLNPNSKFFPETPTSRLDTRTNGPISRESTKEPSGNVSNNTNENSMSNQHRQDVTISNLSQTSIPTLGTQINQQIFRELAEEQLCQIKLSISNITNDSVSEVSNKVNSNFFPETHSLCVSTQTNEKIFKESTEKPKRNSSDNNSENISEKINTEQICGNNKLLLDISAPQFRNEVQMNEHDFKLSLRSSCCRTDMQVKKIMWHIDEILMFLKKTKNENTSQAPKELCWTQETRFNFELHIDEIQRILHDFINLENLLDVFKTRFEQTNPTQTRTNRCGPLSQQLKEFLICSRYLPTPNVKEPILNSYINYCKNFIRSFVVIYKNVKMECKHIQEECKYSAASDTVPHNNRIGETVDVPKGNIGDSFHITTDTEVITSIPCYHSQENQHKSIRKRTHQSINKAEPESGSPQRLKKVESSTQTDSETETAISGRNLNPGNEGNCREAENHGGPNYSVSTQCSKKDMYSSSRQKWNFKKSNDKSEEVGTEYNYHTPGGLNPKLTDAGNLRNALDTAENAAATSENSSSDSQNLNQNNKSDGNGFIMKASQSIESPNSNNISDVFTSNQSELANFKNNSADYLDTENYKEKEIIAPRTPGKEQSKITFAEVSSATKCAPEKDAPNLAGERRTEPKIGKASTRNEKPETFSSEQETNEKENLKETSKNLCSRHVSKENALSKTLSPVEEKAKNKRLKENPKDSGEAVENYRLKENACNTNTRCARLCIKCKKVLRTRRAHHTSFHIGNRSPRIVKGKTIVVDSDSESDSRKETLNKSSNSEIRNIRQEQIDSKNNCKATIVIDSDSEDDVENNTVNTKCVEGGVPSALNLSMEKAALQVESDKEEKSQRNKAEEGKLKPA